MNTQLRGVPSNARGGRVDSRASDSSASFRTVWKPSLRVVGTEFPGRREFDCLPVASDPNGRVVIYVPAGHLRSLDRISALELLLRIRSAIGMTGGALVGIDLLQRGAEVGDSPSEVGRFRSSILIHLSGKFGCTFSVGKFARGARYATFRQTNSASLLPAPASSSSPAGGSESSSASCHAHSLVSLGTLARRAHMEVEDCWTDSAERCELALLTPVRCPIAATCQ
jgi:hypothetical protein